MYPLTFVDLTTVPPENYVHPLWETEEKMHMKVYLSSQRQFNRDFIESEFVDLDSEYDVSGLDTVLLWNQAIDAPSLSKSFLLTSLSCVGIDQCEGEEDPSLRQAKEWLDDAEKLRDNDDGGILSAMAGAGQGIESTSILLTFYQAVSRKLQLLLSLMTATNSNADDNDKTEEKSLTPERTTIHLPSESPMWSSLMSNSTVYVHVVVVRRRFNVDNPESATHVKNLLQQASRSHSLLTGKVGLVKFDAPNHLTRPGRLLFNDLLFLLKRYILGTVDETTFPPWEMQHSQPEYYEAYENAQKMKEEETGYPYWKPEVAVKYLIDTESYPSEMAHQSGMSFVQVPKTSSHPFGVAHVPALYVDEIGLTSEKYVPLNGTVTSLPLHITFDRSDIQGEGTTRPTTATAGGISPARWRLLTHLSKSIESQKDLGFEQSDIDDLRRLIADTNVTLLAITILASALHLLFEFLTFKSEVSFWQNNTDLTGLSVRSLFLDMIGQVIIVLYLIEMDSSLLMTVPSAFGCLIALWKCQRASGLALVKVQQIANRKSGSFWNFLPRLLGYEFQAKRLQSEESKPATDGEASKANLHSLSLECDRIATRNLGAILLPLVAAYTIYSFVAEEHSGWYSWLITSASSAVYALGFVLMTPQL